MEGILKKRICLQAIREEAEAYYRNGDFYCSEAIVATIRQHFDAEIPIEAVAMASGFPVGVGGAKCICGALSGAVTSPGSFFGRTAAKGEQVNKTMALANELHQSFRQKHRVVCCSILTSKMTMGSPEHMEQCIGFTGEIAETTAKIIARELAYELV